MEKTLMGDCKDASILLITKVRKAFILLSKLPDQIYLSSIALNLNDYRLCRVIQNKYIISEKFLKMVI